MYLYTWTTCPKCWQPHTVPTVWMAVTPPPVSCGCPRTTTTISTGLWTTKSL